MSIRRPRVACDADREALKLMRRRTAQTRRSMLAVAKRVCGRNKATRANLPGAGPPVLFMEVETDLARYVRNNMADSFIITAPGFKHAKMTTNQFFLWDSKSVALSMGLRCKALNKKHYCEESPYVWLNRFVHRHKLTYLTPHSLARFDGMGVGEVRRRILGSLADWVRKVRELKFLDGPIYNAWVDETSLLLEPGQSGKCIGTLGRLNYVPKKGSMRYISIAPFIHDAPSEFRIPVLLNLGGYTTTMWEKHLIGQLYNCELPRLRAGGEIVESRCGFFCIAFYGSDSGSTHLNQRLFWRFLMIVADRWTAWRGRFPEQGRNARLILSMDNAPSHQVESIVPGKTWKTTEFNIPLADQKINAVNGEKFLARKNVYIFKIRSRMTSFLCPHDQEIFSELKALVSSNWRSGLISLFSHHVRQRLEDLQEIYGEPRFFYRYGFCTSGDPVSYGLLASRLQKLISEELYEYCTEEHNFTATWQSLRERQGRSLRRASSDLTSESLAWQRPVRYEGRCRWKQEFMVQVMHGIMPRSRTAHEIGDIQDFEVI